MSDQELAPETDAVDPNVAQAADTVETTDEVAGVEPDEESTTSEDDASGDPEKPKRRSRAQERINELTREKYERDRQLAEMQRQMEELRRQQTQQPQQTEDDMPRLADFGYDEDQYRVALQQWNQQKIQSWQEQQQQQMEQQRQMAEAQRQQRLLQERMRKATEKYPDFITKVNDPSLPPLREVNPTAFQAVIESDAGDDVAYYLASNPQEIYRFADMSPLQTVREITMLEMRLKNQQPARVQTPPKPPSTVASGTSEAVTDPNKMTTEQWMEWRNAQLQKR